MSIENYLDVLLPDMTLNYAVIQVLTRPKTYPEVTHVLATTYNSDTVDVMFHLGSKS